MATSTPARTGFSRSAGVGLSEDEAARRAAAGLANVQPGGTTRTLTQIVRANVFTRFNAILGALLGVILVVGPYQDALFGVVLVSNTLIGIVQEVRAKRVLDRLAIVVAPVASVVRDGVVRSVPVEDVVLGDTIECRPGDQIIADGVVISPVGLEVDESLISGEAEAVAKLDGDQVLSGSFVSAGTGRYETTAVGEKAFARQLADQARAFVLVRSELRSGIDRILRLVSWLLLPAAALLVTSQIAAHASLPEAIRASVAGVGSMIPEGLVLLTSMAFAVGALRLGRRQVLVQELAALEGLARVDVLCIDKTGTITDPGLEVTGVEMLTDRAGAAVLAGDALGALAASDPAPNRTLRAIAAAFANPGWQLLRSVPFSSERKWSASTFATGESWTLGAPEALLDGEPRAIADAAAARGNRVLALCRSVESGEPTPGGESVALVLLAERVRPDAADTLGFFTSQGVTVKVLSGDHPATVAAVASRVGLPGADRAVDARNLPDQPDLLADAVEEAAVFGRVQPHQKRDIVRSLQRRGHVVAMVGDGVNDVLALKECDLGVAMGSGTAAARGVARLVVLDDSFATLPGVVAEGRRVIANVERVANLFLTKTVYAFVLALAVGVAQLPFPFLPRHLTIVSSLTIGIPGFFLALAPNTVRATPGFVSRVLRFALPAGCVAACGTLAGYAVARTAPGTYGTETKTVATIVLLAAGLWILSILMRPFTRQRIVLVGGMAAAFVLILLAAPLRSFFALEVPPLIVVAAAWGVISLEVLLLEGGWRISRWWGGRRSHPGADH